MTTRYIASYDTEHPTCLEACRQIVKIHLKHEMPATFFIVGRTLEANAREYRELLDHPLFEIASHTWSHKMLRDHPHCGPAPSLEERQIEVARSKDIIERIFERKCVGLRPGCGFSEALHGVPEVIKLVQNAGYRYVSSLAWGPDYSLPALLRQEETYAPDGFPDLWELPAHGWHENLLKNNNKWNAKRLVLWPPPMPEAIPTTFIKTPEDEVAMNRIFLEKAAKDRLRFVSLIWHPWSLFRFDPEMRMLDLTFTLVRQMKLKGCRYEDLWREASAQNA